MSRISDRLAYFAKIKQRSEDLKTFVAKASGKFAQGGTVPDTDRQDYPTPPTPYVTDRYATDINYSVSQFPDKSAAVVNNDVDARAKKVSQGHFTGASHYLVNEVMVENAEDRGYALMVTGWTGKGTLTKTVGGVVNEGPYQSGTSVVATFTPAAGYSFTSWGDGNTSNPRTFTMNSNIVTSIVTAVIPQHTLAFSAGANGSISATVGGSAVTTGASVYEGSAVVLTATPSEGYQIDAWSGLPEGATTEGNTASFSMPSANVTASVSFEEAVVANYLTFTLVEGEDDATLYYGCLDSGLPPREPPYLSYSIDGGTTWSNPSTGFDVPITEGQSVLVKGINSDGMGCSDYDMDTYVYGNLRTVGGKVKVSGALMSLIDGTGAGTVAPACPEDFYYGGFFKLFDASVSGSTISDASELVLPVTMTQGCLGYLFNGCMDLEEAPAFSDNTTLAYGCFTCMYYACSYLTSAPALPFTTLADYCYDHMFHGCTGLGEAPALPATTLAEGCYYGIFFGCTGLTEAPTLNAETLEYECYANMFNGCSNLSSIHCYATDISAESCTDIWVMDVAAEGYFHTAGASVAWTSGESGIPTNWTREDPI